MPENTSYSLATGIVSAAVWDFIKVVFYNVALASVALWRGQIREDSLLVGLVAGFFLTLAVVSPRLYYHLSQGIVEPSPEEQLRRLIRHWAVSFFVFLPMGLFLALIHQNYLSVF